MAEKIRFKRISLNKICTLMCRLTECDDKGQDNLSNCALVQQGKSVADAQLSADQQIVDSLEKEFKAEQELNEKLLKWVGLNWEYLDGLLWDEEGEAVELFTKSLDACFKYLVPKLKRWEAWSNPDGSVGFRCSNPHLVKGLEFPIETKAETLSVALRLALEKLIKEK